MRGEKITFASGETIEMGQSDGASFKDIVMGSFRKAGENLSVEMRGGFYIQSESEKGVKEVYVVDTRDVACNSVRVLCDFLLPKFDKDMKKAYEKFVKDLEKIQSEFIKASSPDEKVILGSIFYEKTKDKIFLETYKNQRLELHWVLFRAVSQLLSNENYLDIGGGTYQ